MAFDQGLAERIREYFIDVQGVDERKMFGGLCFMYMDYMCVGIVGEVLMVRVGPNNYETALQKPFAREMDFTGKPMKGYIYVDHQGFESDEDLHTWIQEAQTFVAQLPPK